MAFEPIKRLGRGFFGEVWLVYDTGLGIKRAVKYVEKSKIADPDLFFQESQTLRSLEHECIIRAEAADQVGDHLYIAMEYLPGGSLDQAAQGGPVPMRRAISQMCDLLRGLQHAHQHKIIHRDIKPGNALLRANGRAVLSDFGLAFKMDKGNPTDGFGYVNHLAPEVIQGGPFTVASDIFAAGLTLWRLLNGDDRLSSFSTKEAYLEAIVAGDFPPKDGYRPQIPPSLKRVVNRALAPRSEDRFESAQAFRHALEQVEIRADWKESIGPEGRTWEAEIGESTLRVRLHQEGRGNWALATSKRVNTDEFRRVNSESFANLRKPAAYAELRRILRQPNKAE